MLASIDTSNDLPKTKRVLVIYIYMTFRKCLVYGLGNFIRIESHSLSLAE